MLSGSIVCPDVDWSQFANADLADRLAAANASRNPRSSTLDLSSANSPRSVIQRSPIAPVMVSASAGFASSSQRRGVTPLVLLLKRSGNISLRSLTVVERKRDE